MHYFWNVKNVFFKAILKLCSFSFCIWFYVFAPGSHCFAIGILNRPAICTVHFRSTWIAPLRFSTCRSWAGSTVTAAKLDPKKSKFHLPNWMFKCVFFTCFTFLHFLTCFHMFFRVFSKCIFKTYFFTFFPSAFSKRMFSHVFTFFTFLWNNVKNAFWKCAWKKCEKCVLKMWIKCEQKCENWEQGSWKVPVS